MEPALYGSAACLLITGMVVCFAPFGTNRFDDLSNPMFVVKTAVVWGAFVEAFLLFTMAAPDPMTNAGWIIGGIVYVSAFALGIQFWMTATVRRRLAETWKSGGDLPAGVSTDGIRAWVQGHRIPLGRARAPMEATEDRGEVRLEIPTRRSRRSLIIGVPTLFLGALVCAGMLAGSALVAFTGTSDYLIALFAFMVGVFLMSFLLLRVFARMLLFGAFTLFGWLVVDVAPSKLTVRRRLWTIALPPFIEVRDLSRVLDSASVVSDSSDRAMVRLDWHEQRTTLTPRSVQFGAGYLSEAQAEALTGYLLSVGGASSES